MEGHIRERKNKDGTTSYQVIVRYKDEKGKWRQLSGTAKKPREAQRLKAQLLNKALNGEIITYSSISLGEYLLKYLEDVAKSNLTYSTYNRYKGIIDKKINPDIGDIQLKEVKPIHIQDFYTDHIKNGTSSTTVKQYHAILHKALNQAVKWELISTNPAMSVEKPKKAKTTLQVWDENQLYAVLNKLEKYSVYLAVLIAVTTGMRLGEVCGLQWKNVDLKNKILYVRKQLQSIDGALELCNLKTESSVRKIHLIDYTVDKLEVEYKKQEELKIYFTDKDMNRHMENNFVICKEDGSPYDPDYISKNYRRVMKDYKICEKLKIPYIRFHDLRHTHATLLLKAGVNPKVVAERLGHSSISMTLNTYSHVLPDMQEDATKKLSNLINNSINKNDN